MHADPLEAINIIWKTKDLPLIPREDLDESGIDHRDPEKAKTEIFASLDYYVRPEAKAKLTLTAADFDLTKAPRDWQTVPNFDVELAANIRAAEEIGKAVSSLRDASTCLREVVGLPSLFYSSRPENGTLTAIAGYINLVSLRGHVIVAKEWVGPSGEVFGPIVNERLGKILGDTSRVHQVDARYYERAFGSVHCATNVVRAPRPWTDAPRPSAPAASSCPEGCVASSFCKDVVDSRESAAPNGPKAKRVGDLPCVVQRAGGCKIDDCH